MKKIKKFLSDVTFLLRLINRIDSKIVFLVIIKSIFEISALYLGVFFGGRILNGLSLGYDYVLIKKDVLLMVFLSSGLLFIANIIGVFFKSRLQGINYSYNNALIKKQLEMDFIQLESLELKQMLQEVSECFNSNGGLTLVINFFANFFNSFFAIIYSLVLIVPLFQYNHGVSNGVALDILFNFPPLAIILIILLIVLCIVSKYIYQKVQDFGYQFMEENMEGNRIFGYFFELSSDYKYGKTTRLYDVKDLILRRLNEQDIDYNAKYLSYVKKTMKYRIFSLLLASVMMLISYLYVGGKAILGYIGIGAIVSSVTALTTLFNSITETLNMVANVKICKNYFVKLEKYLDLPSAIYHGTLPVEKRDDSEYEIEFKNVSFSYPNTNNEILHNISFKIPISKHLALVGPNGAGKTTFIKLLLRLYDPSEGEILLNGIDIKKYDYDEYVSLMSVVFQDFKLFSLSIKENIAIANVDIKKVNKVIEEAGFMNRLKQLPQGLDTQLYQYNDSGIELSGGEAQKIAISRALYKDAPIIILDEPTAALDPLSEEEIYQKFNEMVKDKTAIFISHRMSSCIFCDEIIVFNEGRIVERGSHKALLASKGLYWQMWCEQAKYYQ